MALDRRFTAKAKPNWEFALSVNKGELLRLHYVHDPSTESASGVSYQCEYATKRWDLRFFSTPYLQREFYQLFCNVTLRVSTSSMRLLRSADLTYSDGVTWRCFSGLFGKVVTDHAGQKVLHSFPKIGLPFGSSSIVLDQEEPEDRILPLLIILLHATAHSSLPV